MLIEESRVFQVATFGALELHQGELDSGQVLADVMVIADDVDQQLRVAVHTLTELGAKPAEGAA
jgi:hypothetical protein